MKHTLSLKNDRRTHFLIEKFGFRAGGKLQLNVSLTDSTGIGAVYPIKAMGLVITVSKAEFVNFNFQKDKCPLTGGTAALNTPGDGKGLTRWYDPHPLQNGRLAVDLDVTEETAGLWSLYWVVCASQPPKYSISLSLAQWNVLPNGQKSFLPTGELPLPYIYGTFTIVCLALFFFWIGYFLCAKNRKINLVHYMMTVLLFFKVLALFCQSFMYGTMARSGDAQGWNIAYYVFQSARAVALFTVVLMIGTGFSFLKAYLTDSDKRLFFIVLPAQVISFAALPSSSQSCLP
jgi:hypothetical protein